MRLRDLYRTEIYDERRETALSPMLLLCLTSAYIITVVSFDRYQTLRIIPLAAYPIFVGLFSGVSGRDLFRKMTAVMPFVILIGIWNPFFDRIDNENFFFLRLIRKHEFLFICTLSNTHNTDQKLFHFETV